jgi:hypothetical protein
MFIPCPAEMQLLAFLLFPAKGKYYSFLPSERVTIIFLCPVTEHLLFLLSWSLVFPLACLVPPFPPIHASGLCPSSGIKKNTISGNWIYYHPQMKWQGGIYSFGSIRKSYFNHLGCPVI